jgi:hypothetical protein
MFVEDVILGGLKAGPGAPSLIFAFRRRTHNEGALPSAGFRRVGANTVCGYRFEFPIFIMLGRRTSTEKKYQANGVDDSVSAHPPKIAEGRAPSS